MPLALCCCSGCCAPDLAATIEAEHTQLHGARDVRCGSIEGFTIAVHTTVCWVKQVVAEDLGGKGKKIRTAREE